MNKTMMTRNHSQCEKDEVYLGDWMVETFKFSNWKTKRMGELTSDLTPHCPVFIKIQEAKDAGFKWSDIRNGFHYITDREESAY